jgi:beta-lactamase class A
MVAETELRRRRLRRPLPPGQRLLLLVLLSSICCVATMWILQSSSNSAERSTAQPGLDGALAVSSDLTVPKALVPQAPFATNQELTELKQKLQIESNKPNLHAGIFVVEPATGKFIDVDARRAYSAASMIKLPVMVALGQALDAKQVSADQMLTIRQDLIGGGSGWLQWRKPGSKLSLKETAELMIIISDNTATNMIIDVLGGKEKLNSTFAQWGLASTRINNPLPDLPGTNTTSPYDLAWLLGKIDGGQLLSADSRNWILTTMQRNKIRTLLPMGVPPGTVVADKTGDIATLVGDAGIITTKNGHKYIATVAVERPWNDRRANALIREISKDVYVGITGDTEGAKAVSQSGPRRHHARHNGHHRRRHHSHRS